jgi:hypothetical protein
MSSGRPSRPSAICDCSASRAASGSSDGHIRLDITRRDRVDQNPARCELLGDRLGQADQPRLGGGVVGLPLVARQPHDARDVDDAARAPLHHPARRGADGVERALEVGIQHRVPVLVLDPHQQVVARDAGVVDEDVERTHLLLDALDQLVDRSASATSAPKPRCPSPGSSPATCCARASSRATTATRAPPARAPRRSRGRYRANHPSPARPVRSAPRIASALNASHLLRGAERAALRRARMRLSRPVSTLAGAELQEPPIPASAIAAPTRPSAPARSAARRAAGAPRPPRATGWPSRSRRPGTAGHECRPKRGARASPPPPRASAESGRRPTRSAAGPVSRPCGASPPARSTAATSPEMTIWPGAL